VAASPSPFPARPGRARRAKLGRAPEPDVLEVTARFRDAFEALGLALDDPHLAGTASRVARAYRELFAGLYADGPPDLRTFPNLEGYSEPVFLTDIPFHSLCAHHLLPFFGVAHVAYVPKDRIVGLSKLVRAVDYCARRPQVQERLTQDLAALLDEQLRPGGVMAVLEARHFCMEMRGVARAGALTTTSAVRGAFTEPLARREFLALLARPRPGTS
jgi:GTP cyclohydrolase I